MNTFETAAVISLVDHLSGPMRSMMSSVAGHESTMARQAARMSDTGRHMTYQMTVPILAGLKTMADRAVEFSKVENTLQGVLQNRARTMQGLTVSTKEFANEQLRVIKAAADLSYAGGNGLPKGMSNVLEYQRSVMAGVKAGMTDVDATDPKQALAPSIALANQSVDLALANRIDQHEATENLISLSNSFGIATKDANNHVLSVDKLSASYGKLSDMLATMTTNAQMTSQDAMESLKLSAPIAHLAHLDPGVLAAMSGTQAEMAIKGSEASVAQRSLLMSLLAPKSTAAAGFKEIGVDLHRFQTMGGGLNAETLVAAMKNQGYRIDAGKASGVFNRLSGDDPNYSFIDATNDLGQMLQRSGKSKNPITPDAANKVINAWVSRQSQSTDVMGLIEDIRDKGGLNPAQWKMIGEGRQYSRLASIIGPRQEGSRDVFSFEMARYFGADWKNVMARSREQGPTATGEPLGAAYLGNAHRQAVEHAQGLEGAYTRMHNAMDKIVKTLSDNGAFDHLASAIVSISESIANANPETLKYVTTLAMVAAAAGPALWVLGTLATAVSAIGRLGGAAQGVEAVARAMPTAVKAVGQAVGATARASSTAAERLAAAEVSEQVAKNNLDRAASSLEHALARAAEAMANEAQKIQTAARLIEPRAAAKSGVTILEGSEAMYHAAVGKAANALDAKSAAADAAKAATHDAAAAVRMQDLSRQIAAPLIEKATLLKTLGMVLKGVDVATWPLVLRDLGEAHRPTTPLNFRYTNDTVEPGWAATWEKSRRAADEMRRDPEGARGRNMMQHGSGGVSEAVTVTGQVSGEAEVHQTMTLEVRPTSYFEGLIKKVETAAKMAITGSVGSTMAGSNAPTHPSTGGGLVGRF